MKVEDHFFITKFQFGGLTHDHGLIWVNDVPQFGISMNENIEIFVDKYWTINQTIMPKDFRNVQIHQHKWTCKKKRQQICQIQYPKPLM